MTGGRDMDFDVVSGLDRGLLLERAGYSRFPSRVELVFDYPVSEGQSLRRVLQIDSVIHFAFSRKFDEHDTDPDWEKYVDLVIGVEMSEATEAELFDKGVYYFKAGPAEGKKRFHLHVHLCESTLDIVTLSQAHIRWV